MWEKIAGDLGLGAGFHFSEVRTLLGTSDWSYSLHPEPKSTGLDQFGHFGHFGEMVDFGFLEPVAPQGRSGFLQYLSETLSGAVLHPSRYGSIVFCCIFVVFRWFSRYFGGLCPLCAHCKAAAEGQVWKKISRKLKKTVLGNSWCFFIAEKWSKEALWVPVCRQTPLESMILNQKTSITLQIL